MKNSDTLSLRVPPAHRSASLRCACRRHVPLMARGNILRRLSALLPAFLSFGSRASLGDSE